MGKRTFTREFKLEAVRMVKERGLAKAQVARDIGVHANVLKNWLDQHDADPQGAFGGTSAKTLEIAQIEQLKRELNRVTAERDILKKAVAYFAKDVK
jgi:transposase